jgi:hypothetical protein
VLEFDIHQYAQIRIDPTRIGLTAGFDVHRLTVSPELLPSGLDGPALCEIEADISVAGPDGRWLATAASTRVGLNNHNTMSVRLSFPLTNQQLLSLEEHRAGQDLLLELNVRAFLPLGFAESREQFRVPASVWQTELERQRAQFDAVGAPWRMSTAIRWAMSSVWRERTSSIWCCNSLTRRASSSMRITRIRFGKLCSVSAKTSYAMTGEPGSPRL